MTSAPVLQTSEHRSSLPFCIVPPDEIAFALALFMGAANCRVATRPSQGDAFEISDSYASRELFAELSANRLKPTDAAWQARYVPSLYQAYSQVWKHYERDELRASICARLLSFYFLMERTKGEAIAHWISACPESPEVVDLHPAIVEALATVPLSNGGAMPEDLFLAMIDRIASCTGDRTFLA